MAIDWHKKLDKQLKDSEEHWKILDDHFKSLETASANAKKFIQSHLQMTPKHKKAADQTKNQRVKVAETAAEASVYQDDLKVATKAKDKKKIKELQTKLKGLEKTYFGTLAEMESTVSEMNAEIEKLRTAAAAIGSAIT